MKTKMVRLKIPVVIDFSAHTTVGETDIRMNGIIREMATTIGALTGGPATVTLAIVDTDDVPQFSQASIAEGATTIVQTWNSVNLAVPVAGLVTVQLTASEAQSVDSTNYVYVWLEQN